MSQYNMQSLTAIIAKLRSKQGGCPWDLEQTHKSLISNLLEETYEVIEAINQSPCDKFEDAYLWFTDERSENNESL